MSAQKVALIVAVTVATVVLTLALTRLVTLTPSPSLVAPPLPSLPKRALFQEEQEEAIASSDASLPYEILTQHGPRVRWGVDAQRESITFEVSSHELMPLGWVAVGFPRSDAQVGNQMIGADAVVATLDAAGNGNVRSLFLGAKVRAARAL